MSSRESLVMRAIKDSQTLCNFSTVIYMSGNSRRSTPAHKKSATTFSSRLLLLPPKFCSPFHSPRRITLINGRCKPIYLFIRHRFTKCNTKVNSRLKFIRDECLMQLDERMATCAIVKRTHKSLARPALLLFIINPYFMGIVASEVSAAAAAS